MAMLDSPVRYGRKVPLLPAAALIAFAFFVKFVVYALAVTPLWDIPDESGHYSYVHDIAQGELPLLGQARMDEQVQRSWINPQAKPQRNWIAQHPPLYYALAAPTVVAARAAGLGFEQQVRAARLPSSLFGGLTILGLVLFLATATGRDELGLAGGIFLGATPMFLHLSSGVSHDTLVACTAAWAAYWVVRWLESDRFAYVLYAGGLVAMCTMSKITGLAMAVPLFFALSWRLWRTEASAGQPLDRAMLRWTGRSAALWLAMFAPVCLWIARNLSHFGQMFPDASNLHPVKVVPIGFFEFMTRFPVWEHVALNFIALVGWNGSGNGVLQWIQASGTLARYFLGFLAAGSLAAVFMPAMSRLSPGARRTVAAMSVLGVAFVYHQWPEQHLVKWTCLLLLAAMLATLATHARAFWQADGMGWLLASGAACFVFFLLAYYETLLDNFDGSMRATHGRYLYPVVPFLLLTLLWPLRERWLSRLLLYAAVGAMLVSDRFFLRQVFAMYGQLPS